MVLPTREALERRRKGYQRRGVVCGVFFALMVAGVLVPHLGVEAASGTYGRSLFPASQFFLGAEATADAFAATTSPGLVALGLNVAYLGLSLQHLGLLFGVFTFWALAAENIGRWTRRAMLVAGWVFTLSAPTVIFAYQLLEAVGIPCYLGAGWALSLAAGLVMLAGARAAKDRVDSTWYWTRPDWNG